MQRVITRTGGFVLAGLITMVGVAAAQEEPLTQTEMDSPADFPFGSEEGFARPDVLPFPDFGVQDSSLVVVPASTCTETENQDFVSAFGWYRGTSTGSYRAFDCPLAVPSGTLVVSIGASVHDTDAAEDVSFTLRQYSPLSDSYTTVATTSTSGSAGRSYLMSSGIDYTVNNDLYDYGVRVFLGSPSSSNQFKNVFFFVRRQVSPAPGTASFLDVPTGHPFFQHVEALVASGITSGCGSNNYCPDSPMTRGQMAVFLAKALGLHYSN